MEQLSGLKRVNRLDDGGLLKIHHLDVIKMIAQCEKKPAKDSGMDGFDNILKGGVWHAVA